MFGLNMDYLIENYRNVVKIIVLVLLCSEMKSTNSPPDDRLTTVRYTDLPASDSIGVEAKYQASIRLNDKDISYGYGENHICSGALVSRAVVLTAAQCVYNYSKQSFRHPSELQVVLGSQHRFKRNPLTLVYGVTHIHRPDPDSGLKDSLAILILERNVRMDHKTVEPIALSEEDIDSDSYRVTSWGGTLTGLPISSLLTINASRVSNHGDRLTLNTSSSSLEHFVELGAPVVLGNKLVGLTSQHGSSMSSVVFTTKVAPYQRWIRDIMADGGHQNEFIEGILSIALFTLYTLKKTVSSK